MDSQKVDSATWQPATMCFKVTKKNGTILYLKVEEDITKDITKAIANAWADVWYWESDL